MASVTDLNIPADCWIAADVATGLLSFGQGSEVWGDELPQAAIATIVADLVAATSPSTCAECGDPIPAGASWAERWDGTVCGSC